MTDNISVKGIPMKHTAISSNRNVIPTPQEAQRRQSDLFLGGQAYCLVGRGQADQAARFILSPERRRPCVLVTRPLRKGSFISAKALADALGMDANVLEAADPKTTAIINSHLPEDMRTRNGAVRVFPVVDAWDDTMSRLYLAYSEEEGRWKVDEVVLETLNLAYGNAYTTATSTPQNLCVDTEAFVMGVYGDKVTLRTVDETTYLQLDTEELPFPMERLFKRGMKLSGTWAKSTGLFFPHDLPWLDADTALEGYQAGMTIPGKISGVYDDRVAVELFPSVCGAESYCIRIMRDELLQGNDSVDLRGVFHSDDVIPVKIEARQNNDWLCSLGSAHDAIPAPSLMSGGSPWLELDGLFFKKLQAILNRSDFNGDPDILKSNILAEVLDVETGIRIASDLCDRLARSSKELQQIRSDKASLEKTVDRQKKQLEDLNEKLSCDVFSQLSGAFEDDREQLDFEIRLFCALNLDEGSRSLKSWEGAEEFYKDLNNLPSTLSRKDVVKAIVYVLADLDERRTHQRRRNAGGSTPTERMEDGRILHQSKIALQYRLYFTRTREMVRFYYIKDHSEDRVR